MNLRDSPSGASVAELRFSNGGRVYFRTTQDATFTLLNSSDCITYMDLIPHGTNKKYAYLYWKNTGGPTNPPISSLTCQVQ